MTPPSPSLPFLIWKRFSRRLGFLRKGTIPIPQGPNGQRKEQSNRCPEKGEEGSGEMSGRIQEGELMEEKVLARIDTEGLLKLAQRLIQIESINPPADYSVISSHLDETLRALGMETHILEGSPGKKNVFGFWRGATQEKVLLFKRPYGCGPCGREGSMEP